MNQSAKTHYFLRAILIAVMIVSFANITSAANHYVLAGASGSGSGSDWTNAYKDLPASLIRGDLYYVAAGTYKGHYFNDSDSGAVTIEVRAATIADHGTATGWNDAYQGQAVFNTNDTSTVGDVFTFNTDYYIINGAYRSISTGNPQVDWQSGYGFKTDNSAKTACNADLDLGSNSATKVEPIHDITIEYVEVNGSHETATSGCRENGLQSDWGSYNVNLQYNYIHDTGLTILLIRGNHQGADGYGSGDSVNVHHNYFARNFSDPTQHAEGCSCSEGLTNFTVANNYWQDINGTAIIATPSGAGYNSGNGNNGPWYIYGNVAFETSCAAVSGGTKNPGVAGFFFTFDTTFTGPVYIANNTIANFPPTCNTFSGILLGDGSHITPMTTVYVIDNLWWAAAGVNIQNACQTSGGAPTCTSITWDYNAYFASPDGSGAIDSSLHKQIAYSNPFVNSSGFNFQLVSHTAAGSNVSILLAPDSSDLTGLIRYTDGIWDRGALQMNGNIPVPAPPTNLNVVNVK